MKKFTVKINHHATECVEIYALTKEEAIKRASQIETPEEELDFEEPKIEVVNVEDAPEYDALNTAETIIKKAYDNNVDFELEDSVTAIMWNDETCCVESAIWDEEEKKIWIICDDQTEHPISDLDTESQLEVSQAIIDSVDYNDIKA